jgi:hypothetical protein
VALALRLLSVCVVAGLCGTAARGQTVDVLKPTLVDDVAVVPRLTIAPEEEPPALLKRAPVTDPFAPLGIRQGGITYFPALAIDAVGSTNASQSSSNAVAAFGLHLRPSLRFESDWVRHAWQGQASGDFTGYLKKGIVDTKGVDASSRFRLDIHHDIRAEFDASYRLNQVGAADREVPNSAIGDRTDHMLSTNAAVIRDFGAFEGQLKLGLERELFGDVKLSGGGKEDNSDRNNYSPSLGLRLAYIDPPALKPFVDVTYAPRFHDQKLDRNGLARDSQGVTANVGVILDRGPIWSGEASIVYAVRDYKDGALETNSAFGINGNLTWKPTELTAIVLTLETSLNESASATSSGSKTYSGRVDVTHALRENINLLAGVGLSIDKDTAGTDNTITSKIGMEWQINPELAWTASYDGTWFKGDQSSDSYNEQRIMTGFVVRR